MDGLENGYGYWIVSILGLRSSINFFVDVSIFVEYVIRFGLIFRKDD